MLKTLGKHGRLALEGGHLANGISSADLEVRNEQ